MPVQPFPQVVRRHRAVIEQHQAQQGQQQAQQQRIAASRSQYYLEQQLPPPSAAAAVHGRSLDLSAAPPCWECITEPPPAAAPVLGSPRSQPQPQQGPLELLQMGGELDHARRRVVKELGFEKTAEWSLGATPAQARRQQDQLVGAQHPGRSRASFCYADGSHAFLMQGGRPSTPRASGWGICRRGRCGSSSWPGRSSACEA